MAHERVPIDVTNNPVLRAPGEEVKRTGTTTLLRADGEELACVAPPRRRSPRLAGKPTTAGDPFWSLTGIADSGAPSHVAENVDAYLAEANMGKPIK
jgi:hypothetical protein